MAAVACGTSETPKADTTKAPVVAMAPAMTEADVAGTWKGTTMPMGSDSVVAKWTQICAAGTCKGIIEGAKDTMRSTYTLSGDSTIGTSQPHADPNFKGAKVIDSWVVHLKDGKAVGTGMTKLAAKPDSVLMRSHFAGSRAP